jgi:hypothetical protein
VNHNLPDLLACLGVGVGLPDLVERKRAIVHEWAQYPSSANSPVQRRSSPWRARGERRVVLLKGRKRVASLSQLFRNAA